MDNINIPAFLRRRPTVTRDAAPPLDMGTTLRELRSAVERINSTMSEIEVRLTRMETRLVTLMAHSGMDVPSRGGNR